MAHKDKMISNKKTGQIIRFIKTRWETQGRLLEIESTFQANSKEPPLHYHPYQEENFLVLSGELTVRIDGEFLRLKAGDTLHVPPNKIHSMWNSSNSQTVVNWKVKPAMNTDNFLENATGLANDDKTNHAGVPNLLQVALLATQFSNVFRLANPPFFLQKIIFTLLLPLSYLLGYKGSYRKYTDQN